MSKTDDAVLAPAVSEGQMHETAEALANRPDHRDTNWDEANVVVGEGAPEPKAEPEPKPTAKTAAKKTAAKTAAAKKSTDPAGAGAEGTTKKEK